MSKLLEKLKDAIDICESRKVDTIEVHLTYSELQQLSSNEQTSEHARNLDIRLREGHPIKFMDTSPFIKK